MKSLFRATIHRDEQRTMTASAAEMRRWRLCEEGKKREPGTGAGGGEGGTGGGRQKRKGEAGIHSRGRKGWCEREEGGGGKACTPTRATFSRSFLRSFVRFFVMTVDETMTYFSGFSLPGCPAALPFTPSLVLPSPFRPLSPGCTPPRVHPGCLRSSRPSSLARFPFWYVARLFLVFSSLA